MIFYSAYNKVNMVESTKEHNQKQTKEPVDSLNLKMRSDNERKLF